MQKPLQLSTRPEKNETPISILEVQLVSHGLQLIGPVLSLESLPVVARLGLFVLRPMQLLSSA